MVKPMVESRAPRGILRGLLRLPIWLYRLGLGWVLGGRFLKLTHIGRKSGQPREAVLEVVYHDRETGAYTAASGWGEKADWLRNVQKTPDVSVQVGRRRFEARARRLGEEESLRQLGAYAREHPLAFKELARLMIGEGLPANEESVRQVAGQVPLVVFEPREGA